MDDEPLYHETFQETLDALSRWGRKHPTEDRDPGELLESEDFHRFINGEPEPPRALTTDDFGAGILDHERNVK